MHGGWRELLAAKRLDGKREEKPMRTWKKPRIVEIAVGLEINSYACAD